MATLLYRCVLAACVLIWVTGCSAKSTRNCNASLVQASHCIADDLENNLTEPIYPDEPLLVASFVDVNNLEQSSSFGRIISEQIASQFAQNGYNIIEMKLRQDSVYIQEGKGEFLLSRDLQEIGKSHNSPAVLVGTYAEGHNVIYVSARIVRTADSQVIASYDTFIKMSPFSMRKLLRDN